MDEIAWALLIMSLPTSNATERMRVWRALKSLGCGVLRDGVYVLPDNVARRAALQAQADEVLSAGGAAYVLTMRSTSAKQETLLQTLFDRTPEYGELMAAVSAFKRTLRKSPAPTIRRTLKTLQRDLDETVAIDYFPGPAQEQAVRAFQEITAAVSSHFAPDEPHAVAGKIKVLALKAYQNRVWATRKHLWIDRMSSAWLIRRFIDKKARFVWLDKIKDCPKQALGFDFDGAQFTHIGARVSFEVLLASFDLENVPGMARLSALVHYLDVGGIPVAEAAGVELILRAAQQRYSDDDKLLPEVLRVFDDIYAAFSETAELAN